MKYINWQTKVLILIVLMQSCIQLKDSVLNEDEFLGNKTNPLSIYSGPADSSFLNPFNINTDNWGAGNIERLMLTEFKDLERYNSIELQIIEKDNKTGALVILYFADGSQSDIYYTPELVLSEEMYTNVLNKTVLTKTPFEYHFYEEEGMLRCGIELTDRFENKIKMRVVEKLGEMQPVGLLAPIGGEAKNPEFMTLVFMKHFKFLSQNEPEIQVSINNQKAELVKLPVKINDVKGFQTKYSMEPVTVSWNINSDNELKPINSHQSNLIVDENIEIETISNHGFTEISCFTGIQKNHRINFRFSPAILNLQCLKEASEIDGRFAMSVDETKGIIGGNYTIQKQNEKIEISIQPTEGYSPAPGKPWMKKMTWKAEITKNTTGNYHINSAWRKN